MCVPVRGAGFVDVAWSAKSDEHTLLLEGLPQIVAVEIPDLVKRIKLPLKKMTAIEAEIPHASSITLGFALVRFTKASDVEAAAAALASQKIDGAKLTIHRYSDYKVLLTSRPASATCYGPGCAWLRAGHGKPCYSPACRARRNKPQTTANKKLEAISEAACQWLVRRPAEKAHHYTEAAVQVGACSSHSSPSASGVQQDIPRGPV